MSGIYADDTMLLGSRRLSIMDTSDAGLQPMSTENNELQIVFNGEIYNYLELREKLDGYNWRSDSDTEVLLRLYDEYGKDCLNKLRGMFAFAIWDQRRQELFLARDRLGQKPLFYRNSKDGFRFASTVGAILSDETITPRSDHQAIRSYLTYQYVPAPKTGFQTIRQLEPGTSMTVNVDGSVSTNSYWSLSYNNKLEHDPSIVATQLREKLREAVKLRMRSDVPLGVFLSGGIDSSVVTYLLAEINDEPVSTYSIGFDIDEYDELSYARLIAEEYGTNHHEYSVDSESMIDALPELVNHYQMPFGDPSALPTYFVSKIAADDVKVALTGDGGDENFAGYNSYRYDEMLERLCFVPSGINHALYKVLNKVPPPWRSNKLVRRPRKALKYANADSEIRYGLLRAHAYGNEIEKFWSGPSQEDEFARIREAMIKSDGPTRLDRLLHTDIQTHLANDILVKVDRASMAHSLEVRSPFLDHQVMEFSAQIPARYKRRKGTEKWILKEAFRDVLPTPIIEREKKGFGVPVDDWFRHGLKEMAKAHLDSLGNRPLFEAQEVDKLLQHHLEGHSNNGFQLWDLVILEEWYQQYID